METMSHRPCYTKSEVPGTQGQPPLMFSALSSFSSFPVSHQYRSPQSQGEGYE